MREYYVEEEKVVDKEEEIKNYQGDPFKEAYNIV